MLQYKINTTCRYTNTKFRNEIKMFSRKQMHCWWKVYEAKSKWIDRLSIVKTLSLPESSCGLFAIPFKVLAENKLSHKSACRCGRPGIVRKGFWNRNIVRLTVPIVKLRSYANQCGGSRDKPTGGWGFRNRTLRPWILTKAHTVVQRAAVQQAVLCSRVVCVPETSPKNHKWRLLWPWVSTEADQLDSVKIYPPHTHTLRRHIIQK